MSEEKSIALKDSTVENTQRVIDAGFKVVDGGAVDKPDGLFEQFLEGRDISLKDVKKTQGIVGDFAAAVGNAIGVLGIPAMEKDKNIQSISVEIPVGNDKLVAQLNRSVERIDMTKKNEDGTPARVTDFGVLNMKYTTMGATHNRGELKKIRAAHRALAAKVLAD